MESAPLLEVSQVGIAFGGVHALSDVSITAARGEILGVIGPNGAGKSTLFNVITGFLRPDRGELRFDGQEILGLSPDERCSLGLVRTWQTPRAFASLTVRENVTAAAVARGGSIRSAREPVRDILDEVGLSGQSDEIASDLPPAFRKRLEIARALARSPRVLLLDEVMAGLTVAELDSIFAVLNKRVSEDGLTIVLIEHVIRAVRSLCSRVVVLAGGRAIAEGSPVEVMNRAEVVEAYLGSAVYLSEPTRVENRPAVTAESEGLVVSNLSGGYGARNVVERMSLAAARGVTALIGSNGAGKTTALRLVTGTLRASSGEVSYRGQGLLGLTPDAIARRGVVLVPEGGGLFGSMSVEENLLLGAYLPAGRVRRQKGLEEVYALLPRLYERRFVVSRRLSGGEQQMLAIGRALMASPRLLILDEPSLGLAPAIIQQVADAIATIARSGVPVLLCEQNAAMAFHLAEHVFVMERGRIVLEGSTDSIRHRPEIIQAYLGG
jgi:branched-chain amino acid transport system permease protein